MAQYFIGDIQGCYSSFKRLVQEIDFSPSRDTLFILGDLVNRGPQSTEVLRQCISWGTSVQAILGNHDLHLLATAYGIRKPSKRDTLAEILEAKDSDEMLHWLQAQPLARSWKDGSGKRVLMVHAGVHPSWTLEQTILLSKEVEKQINSSQVKLFLQEMYGNNPAQWTHELTGADRARCIVNVLTRMRFCTANGEMDFECSESADNAPKGFMPWFECPNRQTQTELIAFGHWSTLGLKNEPYLLALDTGCVWGGKLTAVRVENNLQQRKLIQVSCTASQTPGV